MAGTALRLALDGALAKAPDGGREAAAGRAPPGCGSRTARFTDRGRREPRPWPELVRSLPPGALDTAAHNPCDQFVFPNGCHVAEVEVDPETGAVTLLRYLAVDDYGVLVNPLLTEGQVQGGLAQGIGQAMLEAVHYDPGSGQLLTAVVLGLRDPARRGPAAAGGRRSTSIRPRRNPLGAKGSGQAGAIAAPPVIMSAIMPTRWACATSTCRRRPSGSGGRVGPRGWAQSP